MLGAELIVGVVALYLGGLFYIAYRGDAQPEGHVSRHQALIYTLSLTVYCTSWTFFGAVGNAAQGGFAYFAIYLGPILVFVLFAPFVRKLLRVSRRQRPATIADFIASRYGKSHGVAALVTLIALVGTLPYISLQIKAISGAYDALAASGAGGGWAHGLDTALVLTLILAAFAILFGARTIDATVHHRGMIHAIAFESVIKLAAFVAIAALAVHLLGVLRESGTPAMADLMVQPFSEWTVDTGFVTRTLLAAAAILCLPRQFHVLVVEARGNELPFARWGFPLYLLLFSVAVIPITAAGLQRWGAEANADLFVLLLPLDTGHELLALLAYLGGFSAATGMVIVSTLALSTMVSNDLIFPLMVRFGRRTEGQELHRRLLLIRRLTILFLMLLAYGYHLAAGSGKSLYSMGLLSFAAAIQFLPALVGGLYWRRGHRHGVIAGLLAGFALWIYLLLLPSLASSAWIPDGFVTRGPFGIEWLAPSALFGWSFDDDLTHGVFWSLGANLLLYVLVSLRARHSFVDRLQASACVDLRETEQSRPDHRLRVADLFELCSRFTGEERARRFFMEHGCDPVREHGRRVDDTLLRRAQHLLAGSIGTASAGHLIETALRGSENRGVDDLYRLLDSAGQALRFNREILQVTLDHIGQAVSVVDPELRLLAWNRLYVSLFDLPPDFLHVGKPIEEVIRFNMARGLGPPLEGSIEDNVRRRLDFLRHGRPYTYVREWRDGRVIQTQGARLPDGGFITTFTDITAITAAERELARVNERLESKVAERTRRLSELNARLEEATRSKSRFLAAASHDLTQPLGASKLYLGALYEDLAGDERQALARNALSALSSAETLLRALLDISKLDAGAMHPEITEFPIQPLFDALYNEFSVLARQKGLALRVRASDCGIRSDRNLLRSILQNFLSNAIRYTSEGSVLVACRRAGPDRVRIEVRDSGRGIPRDKLEAIFREFQQLDHATEGVGLGLAICERMAGLLGHRLEVRSREGEGSTFAVVVPRAQVAPRPASTGRAHSFKTRWLEGRRILCVDDDPDILQATRTVLERWGATVCCLDSADAARAHEGETDIVLMDHRLQDRASGLELLELLRARRGADFVGVLITAEQDPAVERAALAAGFRFLAKPVEPAKLRSILSAALREAAGGT